MRFYSPKNEVNIRFVFISLIPTPQIRRIAKDKDFFLWGMWTNLVPVKTTGIATDDLSDVLQRECFSINPKVLIQLGVHLVLCQPQRQHGHFVREVKQLDAIELAQRNDAVIDKQDFTLWRTLSLQGKDIHFKET